MPLPDETLDSLQTLDFDGLEIAFDERLLRPRPWTAQQSVWAADLLAGLPDGPVLELCSGAGHIGLRAVRDNQRHLVCVDVNPVAAAYTMRNGVVAGLEDRVETREGTIAEALDEGEVFPLVIADPPWVPAAETGRFPEDPLLAIDGGDDGMHVVRECLAALVAHLAPQGVALLQLGTSAQADLVAQELAGTRLRAGELRTYGDRGVLLRIDADTPAGNA